MCGIAGSLITDRNSGLAHPDLTAMINVLRHRGPDGRNEYTSALCALAHARLSIIDLETGAQPMANEDGSVWTVVNGEIFNYVELRAELQRLGHRFRTRSDTEVIVHAYETYGERFVDRLNGQFAIALWDARRERLVLARDRVGIRPLFYASSGGRILFASEIKAILAVAPQRVNLDVHALAQIFTFWAPVGARTPFEGIKSLPPGHLLIVENGAERRERYWDWTFPARGEAESLSLEATAEAMRTLLNDAVRLQLRADVPVGVYLSGGLDSSGIAALTRPIAGELQTFSITFDQAEYDEGRFQRQMAEHLGVKHDVLRCSAQDIGEAFPDLIWHTESPVLRTAPAPLMLLARHVHAAGFKVVLTGEGADELFGGYDLFKEGKIRRFWARNPESQWRAALLARLYPYLGRSPVTSPSFARLFFGQHLEDLDNPFYAHLTRWRTTRGIFRLLSPEFRAQLQAVSPEEDLKVELPTDFPAWDNLARDQYIEVKTLLEGYLLSSQGDRPALAHAVECRVPYLDHRVVEFVNGLSPRLKLRGLREKALLKAALADVLPDPILNRPKQPYRAPDSRCFFSDGQPLPYVKELLSASSLRRSGYFHPPAVESLVRKCQTGRALGEGDNMAFVGVLSTQLLHEHFLAGSVSRLNMVSA